MRHRHGFVAEQMVRRRTPLSSPSTDQAQRVLRWVEPRLVPQLSTEMRAVYQQARWVKGTPAKVRVPGFGVRVPVRGSGDDAYGHHRLRAVVREVVLPLMGEGELKALAVPLQRLLRGEFADLYREMERAIARQEAS